MRLAVVLLTSFNPLPPAWAGETACRRFGGMSYTFQSAPARVGGRNEFAGHELDEC